MAETTDTTAGARAAEAPRGLTFSQRETGWKRLKRSWRDYWNPWWPQQEAIKEIMPLFNRCLALRREALEKGAPLPEVLVTKQEFAAYMKAFDYPLEWELAGLRLRLIGD